MNLFANPQYNNYFLKGGSTAKPIVGVCLETAYNKPLNQAKVIEDNLMQGYPIILKNTSLSSSNSNNDGLSGNVFTAENIITTITVDTQVQNSTTSINGFIVNSPNDILLDGDTFPRYLKNQVVRVAVLGSGAALYLPVDSTYNDVSLETTLKWDLTNKCLSTNGQVELPGVRIGGQVVNGLIPYFDDINKKALSKEGLVLRVIL